MPLLIEDSIDTTFLDTAHYDIRCQFPRNGFESLDKIVIKEAGGLVPFVYTGDELKTQEFMVTAIVTHEQDGLLRELFKFTVHPGYIDERYPIHVTWGHRNVPVSKDCYLASYKTPESINYSSAEILTVELTLRVI